MKTLKVNTQFKVLKSHRTKFILVLVLVGLSTIANAQLLKKLGKQTIQNTVAQAEAQNEEPKTTVDIVASDDAANTTTANNFSFSHKYVMQIKDGKRTTDLEYYLAPSGNYFATAVSNKKGDNLTTTVMDLANNKMHLFMDNKGDKTRMSMKLNLNKSVKHAIDETQVTITPTGTTKTILGYTCDGYKVKGDTVEGTIWVTQSAGVTFAKAFYSSDPSNSTNAVWKKLGQGLTMEMDMVDTSRRKPKAINMKCIALDKTELTLNSKDYKKLM